MLRISVTDARKSGLVRIAPMGTEDGDPPCLVWTDPIPGALAPHCKVCDEAMELLTASSAAKLELLAKRLGLSLNNDQKWWIP